MDPFKEISKILKKMHKMIVWLAMHTLSVQEYMEFASEFNEEITDKWNNQNSVNSTGSASGS